MLSYAVVGRTFAWDKALESRIASLTPDEVRDALRRHLKLDDLSTVKAGDFNKVTAKAAEVKPN
jgi:zinc protease